VIISTDLGGTLCGEPAALQSFNRMWLENFAFNKNNVLIYNTGRKLDSFLKLQKEQKLLQPAWLITRTGCYIYRFNKGVYEKN